MERTEIIKALEHWSKNFDGKVTDFSTLCQAISLINELTAENEKLTINMNAFGLAAKRLGEEKEELTIELNAMRTAANSYKMHYEKLEAENERLSGAVKQYEEERKYHFEMSRTRIAEAKADTVRKMQSEIEKRCIDCGIYPAIVKSTIDQVAKEILNDES